MSNFNMTGTVFYINGDYCEVIADTAGDEFATLKNHSTGQVFNDFKEYLLDEEAIDRKFIIKFQHRG